MAEILEKKCVFMELPDAVFVMIFQYLDTISLMRVSCVCRRWYHLTCDVSLSKCFDMRALPLPLQDLWKLLYKKLGINTKSLHIHGKTDRSNNMTKLTPEYLIKLFTRCPNLTNVSFEHFDLRDILMEWISSSVVRLSLSESMLSMDWFDKLNEKNHFPKLTSLNLNNCTRIDNNDLITLSYLNGLESLSLSNCYRISARGIPSIVRNLKTLKYLDFSGCPAINDVALYHLSTLSIKSLLIRFCHLVTDSGIMKLLQESGHARKTLAFLDLFSCHEITDKSLDVISCNTSSLRTLIIGGCKKLTLERIEELRDIMSSCSISYKIIDEVE